MERVVTTSFIGIPRRHFAGAILLPLACVCVACGPGEMANDSPGEPPGANDEPSAARMETIRLESEVFDNVRTLRILLPRGYDDEPQRRYPALYLLDGQTLFDRADSYTTDVWEVDETSQSLIADGSIAPLIVVGVDNPGLRERPNEYLPWPDEYLSPPLPNPQGARFPEFLETEVLPAVEGRYRTAPAQRGLGGVSYGGLIALYSVIRLPGVFDRLLIESPGFYVADAAVLDEADAATNWPARVHVAVGTNEENRAECDPDDRSSEAVIDVLRLEEILARAGLGPARMRVRVHPCHEHDETYYAQRFPAALTFLYGSGRD